METIFRLMLTMTSTFWMVPIYFINASPGSHFKKIYLIIGIAGFLVPVIMSRASLALLKKFDEEDLEGCSEIRLVDKDFIPTYLGYFFVALSINDLLSLMVLYVIVFFFVHMTQAQYFNPFFLFFGYHYYDVVTKHGTRILVICKGPLRKNEKDGNFVGLRRINNITFIEQ